ncbi:LAMI_0D03378g1_1 [Lachancea mirantina]|uniref:ATP-dependent DNA helicase RRM3 n=1 Tax=Lachancea mirantina TaxID=1230905 RepID=A0A1G4J9Z3_9SACH|nr:LAMI_0D03378g1_1 [Lachancea mirantina]
MFSRYSKKETASQVELSKSFEASPSAQTKDSKPAMRQKTLMSFFKKDTRVVRTTEQEPRSPYPKEIRRGRLGRSKPIFKAQGSFDEEDPHSEIQRLMQGTPLKNFKSLSRSSSSLDEKPVSHQPSNVTSSFNEVRTEDLEQDFGSGSILTSTPAPRSAKRPAVSQFSFSLTKRVRPIRTAGNPPSGSKALASDSKGFELTSEQKAVIDMIVWKRQNVFYTGSAGTGKSVVLRELIRQLKSRYGDAGVAVTASTGLAAVSIGGITINRFSGIGIGVGSVQKLAAQVQRNKTNSERWKRTAVLIVDEVSMIDGTFLDKMDFVARHVRKVPHRPFGGIQLVFTGDFFQLPPVGERGPSASKPPFCFESKVWKAAFEKTICLTNVFRQKDQELVDLLNNIRFGTVTPEIARAVRQYEREVEYEDGIMPTELYPTRREVEMSNRRMLERLPGESKVFEASDQATSDNPQLLKNLEALMAEKRVVLKEEAQVMMIKNVDESLVNGSVGKVLYFTTELLHHKSLELYPATRIGDPDLVFDMRLVCRCIGLSAAVYTDELRAEINARPSQRQEYLNLLLRVAEREEPKMAFPMVRFSTPFNGFRYELILPTDFTIDVPGQNSSVSRTQLPLILCWALSIHKAQGQTVDRLKVDLAKIFEEGQVYVALSRAVSKQRLQIVNFNPRAIKANEKVKEFYKTLEKIEQ